MLNNLCDEEGYKRIEGEDYVRISVEREGKTEKRQKDDYTRRISVWIMRRELRNDRYEWICYDWDYRGM